MDTNELCKIKYSENQYDKKREEVRKALISRSECITGGKITRMANSDLALLFRLYDTAFLGGYFQNSFRGKLNFIISTRMTRSAGKISYPKNFQTLSPEEESYELKIGAELFFGYDQLDREKMVNGIRSRDALEALQLVFEHELCHLIELHCFKKSSCNGDRFKKIASNIFGHTASYHQLITGREVAERKYGLRIGDRVSFHVESRSYRGFIARINKRATVMVPDKDGGFKDRNGCRYSRWYVPVHILKKIQGTTN